jgi:hypothetical protein
MYKAEKDASDLMVIVKSIVEGRGEHRWFEQMVVEKKSRLRSPPYSVPRSFRSLVQGSLCACAYDDAKALAQRPGL